MVSALSPLQIGQQEKPDLVGAYLGGRQGAQRMQLNDQAIQQNKQAMSQADIEHNAQRLSVANRIFKKAKELPPEQRANFMASLNDSMLKSVGADKQTLSQTGLDDTSLDAAIAQTGSALDMHNQFRKESVNTNEGLKVFDPSTGTYKAAVGADNKPLTGAQYDAGVIGDIARVKQDEQNKSDAAYKPIIAEATDKAKAAVELATRPEIERATSDAKNESEAGAKAKAVAQKNANALATYEAGIKSVSESLGNTLTGPFVGKAPAMTANQQIADGSLAAMAPVLKGLFREAGEGTFTKEDQQILMDMLPTRSDLPAARAAKLKNVDMLIKTKLTTQPVGDSKEVGEVPKKLTYDPATGGFK